MSGSSRQRRRSLCDQVIERFALSPAATYRDACRRTGEVMSELLEERVELKFVALRGAPFSGATVRRADGSYVVYCARSRSWYHRLGILLHELAHIVLRHDPISPSDGCETAAAQRFMPHLPRKMARIIAGRTSHSEEAERRAEELADQLLERLTERRRQRTELGAPGVTPHVMRIAETLAEYSRHADRQDR